MPSNRTRRTRKQRGVLSPAMLAYLSDDDTGIQKDDYALWSYRHGFEAPFDGDHKPKELWEQYREEFLPKFVEKHPGKRPWPWWQHDAPRWNDPFEGTFFHGTPCEPRQRIGGTGTPDYEVLAYVPHFAKGIPTGWVTQSEEDYYNGRGVDVHGHKIGTHNEGDFKGKAIDPEDPPVFEGEANYLERHGLLSESETRYIKKHPELLEPEKITIENESHLFFNGPLLRDV